MKMTFVESLKKISWQDKLFIAALVFFTLYYFFLFSHFHQFPSEYYGGDHYAHFGSALKIYNTYNPFISSHYYGELQHYPWLTPFLIALFALLTGQDIFQAALFFPVAILFFTLIITYLFGNRYFQNKTFGLLLAVSWAVQLVPSFHPSEFAKQLMIPLLAFFILLLFNLCSKKRIFFAGIILGLAGLQHLVTFFIGAVVFVFIACIQILEKKMEKEPLLPEVKKLFFIAVLGFSIAALFWALLWVHYQGRTVNEWQVYTSASLFPSAATVTGMFLEAFGYQEHILSLLFLGIVFVVVFFGIKNADKRLFVPLLLISAALLGIIHPYITYPLFGFSLGYYRFPIVFVFVRHLLFMTALYYLWREGEKLFVKKNIFSEETKKNISRVALLLIFLWICLSFFFLIQEYKQSERYDYATAYDEKITAYLSLRAFIEKNDLIAKDEITVPIHPDMGFFFNAMTGKNVMISRMTHANPFVDHNTRAADLAVLLYGNDSAKAQELVEKYHLTYFFSETANIAFRHDCLKNWNMTKESDKKDKTLQAYWCILTDPKYQDYLESYGIETTTADVRLAAGDSDVPLTTVLAVKPNKITLATEEVYSYTGKEGYVLLKLYRIKKEAFDS